MNQVSCYIIAYNDPRRIETVIRHVRPYVDDIFVLDGGNPEDETWALLERLSREIEILRIRSWPQVVGYYGSDGKGTGWQEPERRNLCMAECKFNHVLTIDTDELFHPVSTVNYFREQETALYFSRFNIVTPSKFIEQVETSRWYPDYQLRFFDKTGIKYTTTALHCQPVKNGVLVARSALRGEPWLWHYRRASPVEIDIASHLKVAELPQDKPADHTAMMVGPR